MGRQLGDIWLRSGNSAPLDQLNRSLLHLELPTSDQPERPLPACFNLMALLPALRRRLLAFGRPHLPRPVRSCLQHYERQVETHAH